MGFSDDAIAAFQQAVKLNPSNLYAWRGLAKLYKEKGKTTQADYAFSQCISLYQKIAESPPSVPFSDGKFGAASRNRKACDFLLLAEVSKTLEKFTEWAAVARKNSIRDFAKPIEGSDPATQGLVFTVNNGRISLVKKEEYPEKVSEFTEQDIADMKVLLANLPQLEALFEKGPPKSPADALFK